MSWNVCTLLEECIKSIIDTTDHVSVQIIVVDNASRDRSLEMVRRRFPEVETIASETNLGFARANNLGLERAIGRYVVFLNPDTIVRPHALGRLQHFLDSAPAYDAAGPRLVSPDGSVQWVCARRLPRIVPVLLEALYVPKLPIIGERILRKLTAPYDHAKRQQVEAISGAAMAIRRTILTELRGFDEGYLYTGEDMDLCLRLRRRGSKIFYVADASVVHLSGQSSSQAVVRTGTMAVLSMERYFLRSGGRTQAFTYKLIMQVLHAPLILLVGVAKTLVRNTGFDELRWRLAFAKAVWRWRVAE